MPARFHTRLFGAVAFATTSFWIVQLAALADTTNGSTSSTSKMTNIFTPSTYVDYKRFGAEPSIAVDRYGSNPNDMIYASTPEGVAYPGYSFFWKSSDLGESFRLPQHDPIFGKAIAQGPGGGDSHIAIGQLTHSVFFVDLEGQCAVVNVSRNQGENFSTPFDLGCLNNPGVIDDRPWVAADEFAATENVYVSYINFSNLAAPTLGISISNNDGTSFAGDCSFINDLEPTMSSSCPDASDPRLQIAGPVIADPYASSPYQHRLYIPFIRGGNGLTGQVQTGPPWDLWVAVSSDEGLSWTQHLVAELGQHNPSNIFPEMTVDTGGNLYFTWSQSQQGPSDQPGNGQDFTGETDVYYSYSTDGGATWAAPINLSPNVGDSEVFPWMVAGDPGQLDLVYYQASNGQNPNDTGNSAIWNVYFDQSQNALNPGANFKNVQISDHPNHFGQICTGGLGCTTGGNRSLLDFFTVDVDHLGAANVTWADDYNFGLSHAKFSRQVAGNSVFKSTNISLQSTWPIKDHSVTDIPGDVYDAEGLPITSCPSMDLLGVDEKSSNGLVTLSLTLNGPPSAVGPFVCGSGANNGLWGAEFWSASSTYPPGDNFYVAFNGTDFEAGRVEAINETFTSNEFEKVENATGSVPSNCVSNTPCTITMTASLTGLGIKSGAGLYSITGLSLYDFGQSGTIPGTTLARGATQQADAATPFDDKGTGTLTIVQ